MLAVYEYATSAITLTRREWDKLQSGEYLNDVLVLWWLKFTSFSQTDVHVFDPQFYSKLVGGYSSVRRWTRRVDLCAMKWFVVPVCWEDHWSVCVIGGLDKVYQMILEFLEI